MYPLVRIPPFAVEKDFSSFTPKEAKEYLAWFLDVLPQRFATLHQQVLIDIPEWEADFSRSSLEALETWLLSKVEFRRINKEEVVAFNEQMDETPRLKMVIPASLYTMTKETVSLCFDTGAYLGECIIQANNNYKWGVRTTGKKYIYYAQPILIGPAKYLDFSPRTVLENNLSYGYTNDEMPSSPLTELYDYNKDK